MIYDIKINILHTKYNDATTCRITMSVTPITDRHMQIILKLIKPATHTKQRHTCHHAGMYTTQAM